MIDTNTFKVELEKKLTTIISDLESIGVYDETTDDWQAIPEAEELKEADINSEADATEEWNERRSTLSTLEIEYRDIKRALKKIEDGTFGICEISGEAIEEDRLKFKPTARTCTAHMNDESQLPL